MKQKWAYQIGHPTCETLIKWYTMKNFSVLHIAEAAQGVDRYLRMILPLLQPEIKQYLICSMKYDSELYKNIIDDSMQLDMPRSLSPVKIFRSAREIRNKIKMINPDIVYCHSSFAGVLGRLAVMGLKCKVIYNPHGWAFNMK